MNTHWSFYHWFFIGYWINTGSDFYLSPFLKNSTNIPCKDLPQTLKALKKAPIRELFMFLTI